METKILLLPTCAYKWTFSVARLTWWEMKISCSFCVCLLFKREARQKFLSPNSKLQLIASAVDGIHQWKLVLSLGMVRACGGETRLQSYRMARREKNPQKCILGGQEWRWRETRKINNMYEPQKFEEQIMVIAVI